MLLIGCSFAATDEVTSYPVASASEVHSGIVTTVPTATPEEEAAPSPTAQATPTALFVASPTGIPTATSPIPATSTITPTIVSDCENTLEPVLEIDPNWSVIIEQVNQLQGFFSLTISADGQYFAVVERDIDEPWLSHIYLWEVSTGKLLWSIDPEDPIVSASGIAFSPDGKLLVTGTNDIDQHVFVWDVATGELLHKFFYSGRTTEMSFSSDNKYLAVGGLYPAVAAIWRLEDESDMGFRSGNGAVFLSTATEHILAVYKDFRRQGEPSPINMLNLSSGEAKYLLYSDAANSVGVDGIAISSDGQFVSIANYEDGNFILKVFDLIEEKDVPFEEVKLKNVGIEQIDFSPGGHIAILQGRLNIWDSSGHFLSCLNNPSPTSGFVFTPDGAHLLTYSGYKAPLMIWKLPVP